MDPEVLEGRGSIASQSDLPSVYICAGMGDARQTQFLTCLNLASRHLSPAGFLVLCWNDTFGSGGNATPLVGQKNVLLEVLLGRCGLLVSPFSSESSRDRPNTIDPPGEVCATRVLITCRPAPVMPRWQLTNISGDDLPAFSTLFSSVFGHAISPGLWRWKYADGRGFGVAAWRNRRMVAHYGGILRPVLAFGHLIRAVQVCDAMVEAGERAVMTKTGVMYQVTAAFLELFQGLGGIPLAFGFPNRRAMRLGERLGHYAEVGELRELRWSSLAKIPSLYSRVRIFEPESPADQKAVDRLWAGMAADLHDAVVGVRDWGYIQHRYLHHPERHYRLILVRSRWTGIPLGLLVLHQEEQRLALTDLVGSIKAVPLLVMQARRLAGIWGCTSLYTWVSRQHVDRYRTPGMEELDIDVSIPTNSWVAQPYSPAQLRDRWWLTLGDTDFL